MSKNFGHSTVLVSPSPALSGLSVTVQSGHGPRFEGGWPAVWWPDGEDPTPENAEVVQVLSVAGDVLTLSARAQEGTTARAVDVGWNIRQGLTSGQLAALIASTVLKSPSTSGYTGNVATAPPAGQNQPWLKMQAASSPDDSLPDMIQLFSTTPGGLATKTAWNNGNGEGRWAPSTATRRAARTFELAEDRGGPSTDIFVEWSTNPTNTANREPLLGGYGSGHATKPGWVEATRTFSARQGLRTGDDVAGLTAITFRGQRASTGAPTSGTWIAGDVVLDSAGALWLCTEGGTPGTWVGTAAAATAFQAITPGASMQAGSVAAATRIEPGAQAARLRGKLQATGSVSSGATIGTITTAHRPLMTVDTQVRYSGGGARLTITTGGVITMGAALATNDLVFLDSISYDLSGA